MHEGLACFRAGARSQSRDRQTVGGGQHLTSPLPRRSFSPNEPIEIARGPGAFPAETRLQTRELRAHLDGSQPAGSGCGGNAIGPDEGPENARGSRAFPDGGPIPITRSDPVGGGQHLTCALPRRSFFPNEPLEIARGPRAFPTETRLQTRQLRAHLHGSQPIAIACGGNSMGPNEGPEYARGSRAFPDGGPIAITRSAPGWWRATSDKPAPQPLVFFE